MSLQVVDKRRRLESPPDDEPSNQRLVQRLRTEYQESPSFREPEQHQDLLSLRERDSRRPARLTYEHYNVAWICALSLELAAAIAMLDEEHEELPTQDDNHYVLGNIGKHNIVIACLPDGNPGTVRAASVLNHLRNTFRAVKRCLLVGIGAGFPMPPLVDIRLGDVVVGQKVTCYDEGKMTGSGRFQRTGDSMRPSQDMATALSILRARHEDPEAASQIADIVQARLERKPAFQRQSLVDRLFAAQCVHPETAFDCETCDEANIIRRPSRPQTYPLVHYGTIASGNTLIKNGVFRDQLARELDVICAEMEAAGLMGIMPTLVIRGVSDYADSHKHKLIQRHAAANAAAFARVYLAVLKPQPPPETDSAQRSPLTEPRDGSGQAEKRQAKKRRADCLSAMQFRQMNARQFAIKGRMTSTCEWLLQHETYSSWRDDARVPLHKGFIWLRGKPGSGKSTLMRFAYEVHKNEARRKLEAGQLLIGSFFFHARGEELQKSIRGMYRSLVFQLFEGFSDLQDLLDDSELLPEVEVSCPSLDQLQVLFERGIARLKNRQFVCFVDALDECAEKDVLNIVQVFQDLAEEQNRGECRFRVFFSSRHYPHIQARIGLHFELEKTSGHTEDLTCYAYNRLQYKEPEFTQKLIKKANGVFMWLVLVVNDLNSLDSRGQPQSVVQEEQLESLPGDLSDLFAQILNRYKEYMEEFIVAVIWILFSKRPLSPAEFDHAVWSGTVCDASKSPPVLTMPLDEESGRLQRRVTSSCKGLAEITTHDEYSTVQFVHESVRDFLLKDGGLVRIWPRASSNAEHESHSRLRDCCNRYLNSPLIQSFSTAVDISELKAYSLLRYSAQNVLYHANFAAQYIPQKQFLSDFSITSWAWIHNLFTGKARNQHLPETDLLYVLASGGHARLIRDLGDPLLMDCTSKGTFRSPLLAALSGNHTKAVATLLELPEGQCSNHQLLHPNGHVQYWGNSSLLTWAAVNGHKGLLQVLLARGVPVDAKDPGGWSALPWTVRVMSFSSASYSPIQSEICNILLERGAAWKPHLVIPEPRKMGDNLVERYAASLFSWSLEQGHRQVWTALVADPELHQAGWLERAVDIGSLEAMELLLDNKKDSRDYNQGADLLRAALRGKYLVLADRLIEIGADIWGGGDWNKSSFQVVVQEDNVSMLTWLVNHTSVKWHEHYGGQPLINAIGQGSKNITHWLIEHGADIEGRGDWGVDQNVTPLMVAICNGWQIDIVDLFLQAGANVFAEDAWGCTALDIAKECRREEFVRILEEMIHK